MLKSATAGRDLVRAYAYTGLDPDDEEPAQLPRLPASPRLQGGQQGDIRKYGDGKVKANLDIELVVDITKKTARSTWRSSCPAMATSAPATSGLSEEMGVR